MSRAASERPASISAAPRPRAARGARLEARVSLVQKNLFQRAADLSGRTLSEFVVASAQDAAERLVQDHQVIRLTAAEQTAFVKGLLQDIEPGPRLRQAATAYKKRVKIG
jgi:uncharacterized protein (DUF1778 family)